MAESAARARPPAAGMHHFSGRVSEAAYHHLHQYLTAQHREALRITGQSACISYAKSTPGSFSCFYSFVVCLV